MATIPPRRESLGNLFANEVKPRSSLDTLTTMGFSKSRAEKALAATGNVGVNIASNWLLSHVNDLTLDTPDPREYIIYLCPTGDFKEQLKRLWQESLDECGWNSAHIYYPHITLCSFFHMADSMVGVVDRVAKLVENILKEWPSLNYHIGLDLHTENNSFIGFFVTRDVHKLIEDMMVHLQKEFITHGVAMEPQKKQLHMTLAFQYNPDHQGMLMRMARSLSLPKDASWEIRIYSRLPILRNYEVRRVIKNYSPVQADELELSVDDFVFMDPEEHKKSLDGWFRGTSCNRGVAGFYPGIFTQKTSQMDIWTLHRSVKLFPSKALPLSPSSQVQTSGLPNGNTSTSTFLWPPLPSLDDFNQGPAAPTTATTTTTTAATATRAPGPEVEFNNGPLSGAAACDYAKVVKVKASGGKARKLYVVRHAQRCDFSFKGWYERSFDQRGGYQRFDLNCPAFVFPRKAVHHYAKDCPLTEIGKAQARITGEGMKDVGETLTYVYSSCALRCIQTAQQIVQGIGARCQIRVEPALFEWCGWCRNIMPEFMSSQEQVQARFDVDVSYVPLMTSSQLEVSESIRSYYVRSHKATQHILQTHAEEGGNILLVGHSGSMDACTRQLRGKPAYTTEGQLRDVVRGIPYCFLACVMEEPDTCRWSFCQPCVPTLTHGMNKEYDWRSMLN